MEEKSMSYRGKIRLTLYVAAVIIVLGIFGTVQAVKAARYKREATATKQMALVSLDENLSNIASCLEKTAYVSTPQMMSKLSSELWREASGAKTSLSMLPSSEKTVDNTYKFLSQIGEFVMALGRKSASGEKITDEERNQLKELYEYSSKLSEQINRMCYDMQNGDFYFEDYSTTLLDKKADVGNIGKSLDDAEQSLTDFPSLIYDGPFSEHLEKSTPKFLEGLSEASKENALGIAGKVCEEEKSSLKFAFEEGGSIPCYVFQSEHCSVAITKKGGKPLYMLSEQFSGESRIKQEDAVKAASQYLEKIGYGNIKESYYFTEDGICTVNFTAVKGDTVLYPDLIKVSVSLENGRVLSFDATGYISNHHERSEKKPAVSEDEARSKINSSLTVIDTRKCIIPTKWESEQVCYEIHCKTEKGQEMLVYIDSETGEEDNILLLLYSDGGVLTK